MRRKIRVHEHNEYARINCNSTFLHFLRQQQSSLLAQNDNHPCICSYIWAKYEMRETHTNHRSNFFRSRSSLQRFRVCVIQNRFEISEACQIPDKNDGKGQEVSCICDHCWHKYFYFYRSIGIVFVFKFYLSTFRRDMICIICILFTKYIYSTCVVDKNNNNLMAYTRKSTLTSHRYTRPRTYKMSDWKWQKISIFSSHDSLGLSALHPRFYVHVSIVAISRRASHVTIDSKIRRLVGIRCSIYFPFIISIFVRYTSTD